MGIQTTTNCNLKVPVSALYADSKILELKLRLKNTPNGGALLGIIKPILELKLSPVVGRYT